jgi:HEAT repeat protein
MHNLESNSINQANLATSEAGGGWTARTRTDATSLLLELARALRGYCFYGEAAAQRRPLLDRAFRALSGELSRAGSIDLEVEDAGFSIAGLPQIVESNGVLRPLETALGAHGIRRVRIEPDLTRDALHGFLHLLGQPNGRFESPEGFARSLSARDSQGLRVNDIDDHNATTTPKLNTTPPRASASLGAMLIASDEEKQPRTAEPRHEKPTLEKDPLDAPAADDRGERLRARLIELDRTSEDAAYLRRADDITIWAQDLWNDELIDECYRALLVLADHAVGRGGRTETQARAAATCFAQLARGGQLNDLIRRATGPGGAGVRAAQLLLQLGPAAVPVVVDRICQEDDPDRWAPLHSLILALGEASLPTLISAIEGDDDRRARVGIRLAGELQNPAVLPALMKALYATKLSRRVETIRALSFLPGEESKNALARALDSNVEEIAMAASQAVATSEGTKAVPVLLDVLEASLRTRRTNPSCTLVEVLGRLGDERAVPRLCAILERKPLLRRAHHHAIQLATIDALAMLPTKEARRSIERAALHAARAVRDRAFMRLEELSEAG